MSEGWRSEPPDSAPVRIQLRRTKGWRLPENTVVVARPSRWGNPYRAGEEMHYGEYMTAEQAVKMFRRSALHDWSPGYADRARAELRGKNLACWCPLDQPCHADVLLELANEAKA